MKENKGFTRPLTTIEDYIAEGTAIINGEMDSHDKIIYIWQKLILEYAEKVGAYTKGEYMSRIKEDLSHVNYANNPDLSELENRVLFNNDGQGIDNLVAEVKDGIAHDVPKEELYVLLDIIKTKFDNAIDCSAPYYYLVDFVKSRDLLPLEVGKNRLADFSTEQIIEEVMNKKRFSLKNIFDKLINKDEKVEENTTKVENVGSIDSIMHGFIVQKAVKKYNENNKDAKTEKYCS